ncbi:hypothetical protein KJ359_005270 [Pestalotiopsis sp. 9143b]|nr:hypothetical protein KJ359_005270 [Pestalotiopsis sp. 9143b]
MANIASMIGLSAKLPFWSMPGTRRAPVGQQVREWLSHVQDPVESSASPSREEREVCERHIINTNPPDNDTTPPGSGYHPVGYPIDRDTLVCRVRRYREVIQQARADPSLARDEASPGDDTIPCEADETFLALLDASHLKGLDWLCDNVATRSCTCRHCNDAVRGDIRVLEQIVGPARDSHDASPEYDTIPSEDDETRLTPLHTSSEDSPMDVAMHLLMLMLTRDDLFGEDFGRPWWRSSRSRGSHGASLEYVPIPSEDDESPTEVVQRVPRPKERRDRPRRRKRFDNHSKRNKNNKRFDGASRFRMR